MTSGVPQQQLTLDVREDIRHGREPFSRIMTAIAKLEPRQCLLIIAPFEPAPLYFALEKQGFSHQTTRTADGDWEVTFTRGEPSGQSSFSSMPALECESESEPRLKSAPSFAVDARGLEPPQPMVRILEALVSLPAKAVLAARTDRRPIHLYAHLEARGFKGKTEEHPDGGYITMICGI